jgi:hypothetical protein
MYTLKLPSEGAVSGGFDSALHQFLEKPKPKIRSGSQATREGLAELLKLKSWIFFQRTGFEGYDHLCFADLMLAVGVF